MHAGWCRMSIGHVEAAVAFRCETDMNEASHMRRVPIDGLHEVRVERSDGDTRARANAHGRKWEAEAWLVAEVECRVLRPCDGCYTTAMPSQKNMTSRR